MPAKKPALNSNVQQESTFTIEVVAKVFGQGIDLTATKRSKTDGQKDENALSVSGQFIPPLDPLGFVLQQFGFTPDDPNPVAILEDIKISQLAAVATQESFLFSLDDKIFFETLRQTDTQEPAPLVFTFRFGKAGTITFPDNIPVIGDQLSDPETFLIQLSEIVIATADIPKNGERAAINKGMQIVGKVVFFGYEQAINLYLFQPAQQQQQVLARGETSRSVQPRGVIPPASNDSTKWIDIDKTLGPISLEKIGFQFKEGKIWFLINLSFSMGGFDLSLQGFRLGFPPALPPPVPAFGLDGIGLAFKKGGISIVGAFLKAPNIPNYYSGLAVISTAKFSIDAFGGYGELPDKQKAIFIFVSVNVPLGGPAFFFVTGFSLGFGYNMAFDVPGVDDISSLPLLNTSLFKQAGNSPTKALALLNQYVYPESENLWFAVGISFTSFQLIDSRALLVVDIGKAQISVLGLSVLVLPKTGKAFVDVRLGLVVFFKLQEGIFQANAKIAKGSFILDPNCRVFGEFAFYAWFKGPHKGDFVLSIGGYHPRFVRPAHYPEVERVGFDWKVSKEIQILGNVYFALTPSSVMAGFRLEATFQSGELKAWFIALANFLIQWKPFYYDIEVAISLGASYKFFKLEIGAALQIYGPPLGGYVHISWFIISFTIQFGEEADSKPPVLSWQQFNENFLPGPGPEKPAAATAHHRSVAPAAENSEDSEVCRAGIVAGLIRSVGEEKAKKWIVRADELILSTETVIPTYELYVNRVSAVAPENLPEYEPIGIRPMGLQEVIHSRHEVELVPPAPATEQAHQQIIEGWQSTIAETQVAAALWATTPVDPKRPEAKTIKALVGLSTLAPVAFIPPDVPVTRISNFDHVDVAKRSLLSDVTKRIDYRITERTDTIPRIAKGIPATKTKRLAVIEAVNSLYRLTGDLKIVDTLEKFPAEIDAYFQSQPQIGLLETVPDGGKAIPFKAIVIPPIPPDGPPIAPDFFLQKALRTYAFDSVADYTAIQQALIRGQLGQGKPVQVNAYDGANYLFAITAPDKLQIEFAYAGNAAHPLYVFYFNAYYQVVNYQLLTSSVSSITIPKNIHQITFSGLPPISDQLNVCGWTVAFHLPRVNSLTILGKQLLLKPQAPLRTATPGEVKMSDVLAQNQYLGDDEQACRGWIDTLLFAEHPQQLVCLFEQLATDADLPSSVRVSIPYVITDDQQGTRQYTKLALMPDKEAKTVGRFERLRYSLPTDKLPDGTRGICLRVQVAPAAQKSWQSAGAFVLCSETTIKEDEWLNPELIQLASPFAAAAPEEVPAVNIRYTEINPTSL